MDGEPWQGSFQSTAYGNTLFGVSLVNGKISFKDGVARVKFSGMNRWKRIPDIKIHSTSSPKVFKGQVCGERQRITLEITKNTPQEICGLYTSSFPFDIGRFSISKN